MKTECREIGEDVIERVALDDLPSPAGRTCVITARWVLVADGDGCLPVIDLWDVEDAVVESSWSPIFHAHVS